MPRGPRSQDAEWFGEDALPRLRRAAEELAWLLGRGYAERSALKLVGDRHQLHGRQRTALWRAVAAPADVARRRAHEVAPRDWADRELLVDGFNVLITTEVGLQGGPVVVGLDGAWRDLAGVHGSYRPIDCTQRAIERLLGALRQHRVRACRWLLDRPVSNSGNLASLLRQALRSQGATGVVEVVDAPDAELAASEGIVCSSDGVLLDRVPAWADLPRAALAEEDPWCIELGGPER